MKQNYKDHPMETGTSRRGFLKMAAVVSGILGFPGIIQAADSLQGLPGLSERLQRPTVFLSQWPVIPSIVSRDWSMEA